MPFNLLVKGHSKQFQINLIELCFPNYFTFIMVNSSFSGKVNITNRVFVAVVEITAPVLLGSI